MAKPPPLIAAPTGELPLDRALGLDVSGDAEGALRWAIPLAKLDLKAAGPLFVIGRQLRALEHRELAIQALEAAADRAADSGNLPMALASIAELTAMGADASERAEAISKAYGKGSGRLRPNAPSLPPLSTPELQPLPAATMGQALIDAATQVVEYAKDAQDGVQSKGKDNAGVPAQSLFSSLSAPALRALMGAFEVRLLAKGEKVIEQGARGAEAFVLARGELEVFREQDEKEPMLLARLGSGAVFGEMALLSRSPRAASVVAARASVVLIIRVDALDAVAGKSPEVGSVIAGFCHRRMVANLVRTSPLLASLSASERAALIDRFQSRTFETGDKIISEGKESDGLHVIASGSLSVVRNESGEDVVIAELGVGEVAGEVSLVFRRASNADVVAGHPTMTLFLPRSRFMEIVREHPTLLSQLYALAAKRDDETASIAAEEASDATDLII
ncbi:MAG TPA: cyclic nucleotide-binding domain-containing protein [Polyangiaceae bacterium]|nr:cyclic nucleotide-binding domain-containing protein [Polyangiaceae bacterium]